MTQIPSSVILAYDPASLLLVEFTDMITQREDQTDSAEAGNERGGTGAELSPSSPAVSSPTPSLLSQSFTVTQRRDVQTEQLRQEKTTGRQAGGWGLMLPFLTHRGERERGEGKRERERECSSTGKEGQGRVVFCTFPSNTWMELSQAGK